jgi:hypothetical protein
LTFQKTGTQSVIPAVEFLARIKYLLTHRSLLSYYEGFLDEAFDASQGAQKRTASDKYHQNCCRKPARDVVLCHHNLKFAAVAWMLRPIGLQKKVENSSTAGL